MRSESTLQPMWRLVLCLVVVGPSCKRPGDPPPRSQATTPVSTPAPSLQGLLAPPGTNSVGGTRPLPAWDPASAEKYAAQCAQANERLTAVRVRDCACETQRWSQRDLEAWRLNQQPLNAETCASTAGRKAWFGEKASAFLSTCAQSGKSAQACHCLLEVMFTRNLTDARLSALTAAHDPEIEACSAPTTLALSPGDYAWGTAEADWARDAVTRYCQQAPADCVSGMNATCTSSEPPLHVDKTQATLQLCPGDCRYRANFGRVNDEWQVTSIERLSCRE